MLDKPHDRNTTPVSGQQAADRRSAYAQEHAAGWTPERIEEMTRLWTEGASASAIARALGGGLTRNGVLGKVHRMGLGARRKSPVSSPKAHGNKGQPKANAIVARTIRRQEDAATKARRVPTRETAPPVLEEGDAGGVDVTRLIGLVDLTNSACKWPVGDPLVKGFGFCGQPAAEGKPYCELHCSRSYVGFTAAQLLARQK